MASPLIIEEKEKINKIMRLIGKCLDLMTHYGGMKREWILATRKTSSQLKDRPMPNLDASLVAQDSLGRS